ncbi:unnamed protein product [marine sediment metagenome]|uniref:Uncharacterized protein n=1 Tax=marine sediment metagenome TaxID=412755 RepID=X0U8X9_9ZZZZ
MDKLYQLSIYLQFLLGCLIVLSVPTLIAIEIKKEGFKKRYIFLTLFWVLFVVKCMSTDYNLN